MQDNFYNTWEIYTSAWKVASAEEKQALFAECLDQKCTYNDPLIKTIGWDELVTYMLDFHKQVPGGYFQTNYFLAHNDQSIAKWEMKNADNAVIGEGISYGKFNENGKLAAMTGFFDTP